MNKFVLLLMLLLPSQTFAQGTKVEFPFIRFMKNAQYGLPTRFLDGNENEGKRVADDGSLIGYMFLPPGSSKIPFVIVMHGCSGYYVSKGWSDGWVQWLNSNGIGAFAVDSDGPRHKTSCAGPGDNYWSIRRTADAFSALEYLRQSQPRFDDSQIYVLGMSNGARAVLRIMDETARLVYPHPFTAGISLYANCEQKAGKYPFEFYAPIYEYIGTEDDASSHTRCVALEGTPNFHLKLYKGAFHGFDIDAQMSFDKTNGVNWRIGPDYKARTDVMNEVVAIIRNRGAR